MTAVLQAGSDCAPLTDEDKDVQEGHRASEWQTLDLTQISWAPKATSVPLSPCLQLMGIAGSQEGRDLEANKGQE